jgi:hypothetical protein
MQVCVNVAALIVVFLVNQVPAQTTVVLFPGSGQQQQHQMELMQPAGNAGAFQVPHTPHCFNVACFCLSYLNLLHTAGVLCLFS